MILIGSVFDEAGIYKLSVFLEERFHKLADYIWYRYYIKTGLIFPIVLKAIRQVHLKSNIFVTIGYF